MNGLRLVLFYVNSDAGFGHEPRRPLAFFTGGATALPLILPSVSSVSAGAAPVREPEEETA